MDDSTDGQIALFVKLTGGRGGAFFKVLEVKESEVEPVDLSGNRLFACCNFSKGEIVSVYHGNVIEKNVDSIYSITNGEVILDAGPWMEGNLQDIREGSYLGAHMANDPGWAMEGEDVNVEQNNSSNVFVNKKFELVASKPIKSGDEILYDYDYKHD